MLSKSDTCIPRFDRRELGRFVRAVFCRALVDEAAAAPQLVRRRACYFRRGVFDASGARAGWVFAAGAIEVQAPPSSSQEPLGSPTEPG